MEKIGNITIDIRKAEIIGKMLWASDREYLVTAEEALLEGLAACAKKHGHQSRPMAVQNDIDFLMKLAK